MKTCVKTCLDDVKELRKDDYQRRVEHMKLYEESVMEEYRLRAEYIKAKTEEAELRNN